MSQLWLGYGLCLCGCGQRTEIAKANQRWVKAGEPYKFVHGHARRKYGEQVAPGKKRCASCCRVLDQKKFSTNLTRHGKPVLRSSCKRCCAEQRRRYEKDRTRRLRVQNLRKYNLTVDDHAAMVLAQKNRCAICNKESDKPLGVDHDHTTGAVRKLLCHHCNAGLGNFREKPELFYRAITYLESFSAPPDFPMPI